MADEKVHLYQLMRGRWTPNVSPPCLKVEIFLRLHKIPYEAHDASQQQGPEGRWPWITHKGKTVSDSIRIIEYLTSAFDVPAEGLTTSQVGDFIGLRRVLEDSLYFCVVRHMLVDEWRANMRYATAAIPDAFLQLLYLFIRGNEIAKLNMTNIGDLSYDEYHAVFRDDLKFVDAMLRRNCPGVYAGEKSRATRPKYILGTDRPTVADCVAVAHLLGLEMYNHVKEFPVTAEATFFNSAEGEAVRAYAAAMAAEAYPDMDTLLQPQRAMPLRKPWPLTFGMLKVAGVAVVGATVYATGAHSAIGRGVVAALGW